MKAPNPTVGTVPCPIGGCTETCTVRKFRHRAVTDAGRRNAGKFYIDCTVHGRMGFDGKAAIQEHVLEHIAWSEGQEPITPKAPARADVGAGSRGTEAAPRSLPAPVKKAAPSGGATSSGMSSGKQTPTQTQTAPAAPKKRPWWENLP